jgi:hypothetical protein
MLGAFENPKLALAVFTLGEEKIARVCGQLRLCPTQKPQPRDTTTVAIRASPTKNKVNEPRYWDAKRDCEDLERKSN